MTAFLRKIIGLGLARLILDTVRAGAGLPAECVRIAVF